MSDSEKERCEVNQTEESDEKSPNEEEEFIDCGTWTFPWLFLLSLYRLLAYVYKLYEDGAAVSVYYNRSEVFFCILAVLCLALPALIYTVYLILCHLKQEDAITKQDAGTKVANGLLLIAWQIKSTVEVLHFSVQRICEKRPPSKEEKVSQLSLERRAVVLEFFEDFFAGFIQLLAQTYIILTYYERVGSVGRGRPGTKDDEIRPIVLYQEFVASGLVLLSMLMAVRQKDDGILTTALSFLGWSSIMASRAFTIALAASVIHSGIIGFCFLHAIAITMWLTPICWRSHTETQLSRQKKIVTTFLIFFLFGLPSLTYWPLLFDLKTNKRPAIYMAIITIENAALFFTWYFLRLDKGWDGHSTAYVAIIAGGTCVGCLFILMYMCMKPKFTQHIVLHDMKTEIGMAYGMYYDFFDITFELRVDDFVRRNLHRVR